MPFGHFVLRRIVRGVMVCSSCFVIPYAKLKNRKIKHRNLPAMKSHLLEIPAIKLAQMIRTQEVKCEEVVSVYIQRVQEVNPYINAVVQDRFEAALEEAKMVDDTIRKGLRTVEEMEKETPLLGVPITVKESIPVKGMSNQGGRVFKNKVIADRDAPIVENIKKAGAIILLVSNTPELCLNWETYNHVTGLTKNPHNQHLTAGGSSGGEAALIASGASLFGLTSDIAGSSRLPAMFVGVFGHKPTPRAVSVDLHYPGSDSPSWPNFFCTGPMTRYAVDLPLLLDIMRGDRPAIDPLKEIPLSSINFYYMENDGPSGTLTPLDKDVEEGLLKVAKAFDAKKVHFKLLKYAMDMSFSAMLRIDKFDTIYTSPEEGKTTPTVTKEFLKFFTGQSDSVFTSVAIGLLQNINQHLIPKSRHKSIDKMILRLRSNFQEVLGPNGVFIYPSYPTTAHRHFEIYHKLCDAAYMMIFNTLGFPATNCVIGKDRKGLPIGIQIVSLPGNDHLNMTVAKEIERLFGGWVKPPMEPKD